MSMHSCRYQKPVAAAAAVALAAEVVAVATLKLTPLPFYYQAPSNFPAVLLSRLPILSLFAGPQFPP
jgi:hypothetical protein